MGIVTSHMTNIMNSHHAGVQTEFTKDVCALSEVKGIGNPFLDDGTYIVTLDTKLVMDSSIVQTLKTIESIGKE